jgi:hypothetical protein
MQDKYAVVVTTIGAPTRAVLEIRDRASELAAEFYIVGDTKSPDIYDVPGARWFDVDAQRQSGLSFAQICPTRHYARKNIGYLLAIRDKATVIVETDDDNLPLDGFWTPRRRLVECPVVRVPGWCNAYRYFTDTLIWPRGLPLSRIHDPAAALEASPAGGSDCPIQQGLANDNPDVDAIYRLVLPLPVSFEPGREVVLAKGVWCPFNSQNTTFWRDAFPLLYLPSHCSFRMTDIWRSFVAQRLAWECGWTVQFHSPTVRQDRNEHDLMLDFADEVPGYLENERIRKTLEDLPLQSGRASICSNLRRAYDALIHLEVVQEAERSLLDSWIFDLELLGAI